MLAGEAEEVVLALAVAFRLPGLDRTGGETEAGVGDDQAVIDADHPAEAAAGLAGAERRVE